MSSQRFTLLRTQNYRLLFFTGKSEIFPNTIFNKTRIVELLTFCVFTKALSMYRSHIVAIIFLLCSSFHLQAQQQQKVTLKHVTVFLRGAELESTARISLPAGGGEVIFTNIADEMNGQSINVGVDNKNVQIQSVTFQDNDIDTNKLTPIAQLHKDSLTMLGGNRQQLERRIKVIDEQVAILKANEKVSGNNSGLNIVELQKMLDLVNVKMLTLLDNKYELETRIKVLDDQISRITPLFANEKLKEGGYLVVRFYNRERSNADVTIRYVSDYAGWKPSYDVRTNKIGDPLTLNYRAAIHQNTGIKWNDVQLALSTGNPTENASTPVYVPAYLSFYQPQVYSNAPRALYKTPLVDNSSANNEVRTNADERSNNMSQGLVSSIDVATNITAVATNYDIELPYTIADGAEDFNVLMKTETVPASYQYYSYPRADKDAFLQALVTNWGQLNLLSGSVNIYFEGTYVGNSYLNTNAVTDTLTFSLGRDKKIVVKREQDIKMRSVKTIGSNVREQYGFTTTVRNTHSEPVDIVVADQVPISNDKDISVEDIETSGGTYNDKTGEVIWRISLKANEARELKIGYTIKYPKGKTLNAH